MTKIIKCDCGVVIRGDSDEDLVKGAQAHSKDVHDMEITAEQALAMAEPAP